MRHSTVLAAALFASPVEPQSTSQPGLSIFAPTSQTQTYLIDTNGQVLHSWDTDNLPGSMAYLRADGNLIRTYVTGSSFGGGILRGDGGGLQEVDWNGNVLWDVTFDDGNILTHHDSELMPNGNVLLIAWERKTQAETIAAGRNPLAIGTSEFYPDAILEVQKNGPSGATIVWEWHAWDHLVQDFDPTQANFGDPSLSPELIDVNFPKFAPLDGDWLHVNGIDYHEGLDQIVISPRQFEELWVIDHSTTTAEAADHTGGDQGMGGDLLYRWGNPQAYRAGTVADQQLFSLHDPNWIDEGFPGAGNIIVFSNGGRRPAGQYSTIEEIVPPVDATGAYTQPAPGAAFDPPAPVWNYTAPNPTDFYSRTVSGVQRMRNGNTLISSGDQAWIFEVDPAGNIVFSYFVTVPTGNLERIFKSRRYEQYFFPSTQTLSASTGGAIELALKGTFARAFEGYLVLASLGGTSPGTPLPSGVTVPLNYDALSDVALTNVNLDPFLNFLGALDPVGSAQAALTLLSGVDPSLVGLTMSFAYVNLPSLDFASNPVSILIDP